MKPYTLLYSLGLLSLCILTITCKKKPAEKPTLTDVDGNQYPIVTIGQQTWMAQNLRTTHYRNGDPIQQITEPNLWINANTGACQIPPTFPVERGNFYNYFAMSDAREIAPEGWHIPTKAEWEELATYLGGLAVAGGKLKDDTPAPPQGGLYVWGDGNIASNESGFTALPTGIIMGALGTISASGSFHGWTSNLNPATGVPYITVLSLASEEMIIGNDFYGLNNPPHMKHSGLAIRCIKDK